MPPPAKWTIFLTPRKWYHFGDVTKMIKSDPAMVRIVERRGRVCLKRPPRARNTGRVQRMSGRCSLIIAQLTELWKVELHGHEGETGAVVRPSVNG